MRKKSAPSDQRGITPLLLLVIMLAGIALGLYLIKFSKVFSPKAENLDRRELPLIYSADSEEGLIGQFTTYVYSPSLPTANYNFIGLKGSVAIQAETESAVIVLFSLLNFPDGNCPATGRAQNLVLSRDNYLSSFILKLNKPGVDQVATDFILPVKVPLKGCMSLAVSGGETEHGALVHMNSNAVFLYDTGPAVSPAPFLVNMGDEYCIGRPRGTGCFISQKHVSPLESFALFKKLDQKVKLWSLTGNMAVGGLIYPPSGISNPSGNWTTTAEYYIYPKCTVPPPGMVMGGIATDSYGPSTQLSQPPGDAVNLYNLTLGGVGKNGTQQLNIKYFEAPPILEKGDCLVHLQRFNADGALSAENQIYVLVQPLASPE